MGSLTIWGGFICWDRSNLQLTVILTFEMQAMTFKKKNPQNLPQMITTLLLSIPLPVPHIKKEGGDRLWLSISIKQKTLSSSSEFVKGISINYFWSILLTRPVQCHVHYHQSRHHIQAFIITLFVDRQRDKQMVASCQLESSSVISWFKNS